MNAPISTDFFTGTTRRQDDEDCRDTQALADNFFDIDKFTIHQTHLAQKWLGWGTKAEQVRPAVEKAVKEFVRDLAAIVNT